MCDHVTAHEDACRACAAIVVDVVDGNACKAELVEDSLATGAVTVAVTSYALLYIIVVDLSIQHGLYTCLEAELCVVDFASRLDEFGHTDAKDVAWCCWFLAHDSDRLRCSVSCYGFAW